jgi:DNA-binding transcriptional MerR regulator
MCGMTKEQVKQILDRVLEWPAQRQEDAARMLREMERQDESRSRLTDDQVAEVERRRAAFDQGEERYATDEELAAFWQKCGL